MKQQSKLAFSTKPKAAQQKTETKDEPSSSPEEVKKEQNGDAEANGAVDVQEDEDTMEVDSPSSDASKKRSAEEEEESDDEPPTKRQRMKSAKETEKPKKSK